jgi:hypothetical protein
LLAGVGVMAFSLDDAVARIGAKISLIGVA